MQKLEQIYEGKAKKVFKTDDPELLIVDYKDDATAFNGLKKGTILGKGVINNQMTNRLMAKMEKAGIPTHFVRELSQRETLVKRWRRLMHSTKAQSLMPENSGLLSMHRRKSQSPILQCLAPEWGRNYLK